MALYDLPRAATGRTSFGGWISALVSNVIAWNDARVTRKALGGLTDRELDDIGLVRGDIDGIADGELR